MGPTLFVSFNSLDRDAALTLADGLSGSGQSVWIDSWQSKSTLSALADALNPTAAIVGAAIILIGEHDLGLWQGFEARLFVRAYVDHGMPIMIGLLPKNSRKLVQIPSFLDRVPRVDCSAGIDDRALTQIVTVGKEIVSTEDRLFVKALIDGSFENDCAVGFSGKELEAEFIMKLGEINRYAEAVELFDEIIEDARSQGTVNGFRISYYLNEKGLALLEIGRPKNAETAFREAIAIDARSVGLEHPVVSSRINNLGLALVELGFHAEAEEQFRVALALEESRSASSGSTATTLSNLSLPLRELGRYDESRRMLERALDIDRQLFGPDSPRVARDLANLASVLLHLHEIEEAEAVCRRSIAIDARISGNDHPLVVDTLSILAEIHVAKGAFAEAERLLLEGVSVDQTKGGPAHTKALGRISVLAKIYLIAGRHHEAQRLYERILTLSQCSHVANDKHAINARVGISGILMQQMRYADAAELLAPVLREALRMGEEELPRYTSVLNSAGEICRLTGDYRRAEDLLLRALAIDERSLGPDHPVIAVRLNNIGLVYEATGRLDESIDLARRAISIDEAAYGPDHEELATDRRNLGLLLLDKGESALAEQQFRRAAEIATMRFGPEHPAVALALSSLAVLNHRSGRPATGVALMRRAVAIDEAAHGLRNPQTAIDLHNLGMMLVAAGETIEAAQTLHLACRVMDEVLGPDHSYSRACAHDLAMLKTR